MPNSHSICIVSQCRSDLARADGAQKSALLQAGVYGVAVSPDVSGALESTKLKSKRRILERDRLVTTAQEVTRK